MSRNSAIQNMTPGNSFIMLLLVEVAIQLQTCAMCHDNHALLRNFLT